MRLAFRGFFRTPFYGVPVLMIVFFAALILGAVVQEEANSAGLADWRGLLAGRR